MRILLSILFLAQGVWAAEPDIFSKELIAAMDISDQSDWVTAIKKYYNLEDLQIKRYMDRGYSYVEMTIAAQMAKQAKKSTDDVWKLREGKQLTWPDIAKELNVKPEAVTKEVAKIRKEIIAGKFAPKIKPFENPAPAKKPTEKKAK